MDIDMTCSHEWRKGCIAESLYTWRIHLNLKMNFNTKKQFQVAIQLAMITRRIYWHNSMNDDIKSGKATNVTQRNFTLQEILIYILNNPYYARIVE
ncbi:28877_t:CDS:2 [Gigaspora margarita]|uniref:28877_t:CDS:1 n=1 Tax=Gigaspora margarita TaxID=4874 RepID=A0ABN7UC65_GIGMA|nr:28877_t:CDS:2 [Gigaspora margarita]